MAKVLTNQIKIIWSTKLTDSEGLAATVASIVETLNNKLDTVVCNLVYTTIGTIAGGSNDIDLSGSLEDPLGAAVVFAKVMAVFIRNNGANAMTVGGANNIPIFADTSDLLKLAGSATDPKAFVIYVDENGVTVTAGTGDLITIAGTNGDTYDIIVVGAVAV